MQHGNRHFDLVLMDMQMPVMDGFTAAGILRQKGYQQPIIALTADAMKGTESRCLNAGCTGFLTKPIDMDNLIQSLSEVLGRDRREMKPAAAADASAATAAATTLRAPSTRRCRPTTSSSVRSSPSSNRDCGRS